MRRLVTEMTQDRLLHCKQITGRIMRRSGLIKAKDGSLLSKWKNIIKLNTSTEMTKVKILVH